MRNVQCTAYTSFIGQVRIGYPDKDKNRILLVKGRNRSVYVHKSEWSWSDEMAVECIKGTGEHREHRMLLRMKAPPRHIFLVL